MSNSLYKKFETNSSIETSGVFLDYGDGVSIRIRRAGGANKEFLKALEKTTRAHRFQIQSGRLSMDEDRRIMIEIYAATVVLGWEGVVDKEGKVMPFSRENCIKLFTDLPDLYMDVQAQANNAALFLESIDEADAKNS